MVFDSSKRLANPLLSIAILASTALYGCGGNGQISGATAQGTVNLEGLKVGVPESVIKEAVLTFVLDEQPAAKTQGKAQYISRSKDSKGGQYMVQCRDGKCFRLEALYDKPLTREQGAEIMKQMLPPDAPPQSKVVDKLNPTGAGVEPKEKYIFGEEYVGELVYTSPEAKDVRMVATVDKASMKKLKEEMQGGKSEASDDKAGGDTKAEGESKDESKTE